MKFKWMGVEQKVFDNIKRILAHNNLLVYLGINNRSDIHPDARNLQIGTFITQ